MIKGDGMGRRVAAWMVGLFCAVGASAAWAEEPAFDLNAALRMSCGDLVEAVNRGIEAGSGDASLLASTMFERGHCVKKDPQRAAVQLQLSAAKGNHRAAGRLAMKFALGDGVKQSYATAGAWSSGNGMSSAPLTKADYSQGYAFAVVHQAFRNAHFPAEAVEMQIEADLSVEFNTLKPNEPIVLITSKRGRTVAVGSRISRDYGREFEQIMRDKLAAAVRELPAPQPDLLVEAVYKSSMSYNWHDRGEINSIESRLKGLL